MILHNESGTKTRNARTAEMYSLIFHFSLSSNHHLNTQHMIDDSLQNFLSSFFPSLRLFIVSIQWFKSIGLIVHICHAVRFFCMTLNHHHNSKHLIFLLDLVWKWTRFDLCIGPFFPYLKIVHSTAKVQIHDQMPSQKVELNDDDYSMLLFSKNERVHRASTHFGWNCIEIVFKC